MRRRKQDDIVIGIVVALVVVAVVLAWIVEHWQTIILWSLFALLLGGFAVVLWLLYRINRW